MCWRQVSKPQKTAIIVIYILLYILASQVLHPDPTYNFVSDDLRIGDKYVLIYLVSETQTFSDIDGAAAFGKRCGYCFVTNNKGFLPMSEYDAIISDGQDTSIAAFVEKRYRIETSRTCLRKKFVNCVMKPRISSDAVEETFDLCSLCQYLHKKRLKVEQ